MALLSPDPNYSRPTDTDQATHQQLNTNTHPTRYPFLDSLKGLLVFGMVVFHSINYFAVQYTNLLPYLRMVSAGFIFISGYILSAFYAQKAVTNPAATTRRILKRGLTLLILFTVINLSLSVLSINNFNSIPFDLASFRQRIFDIYVIGNGKFAAFEILLPISYLLLLGPLLLFAHTTKPLGALFAAVLAILLFSTPKQFANLSFVLTGLFGFQTGKTFPPATIANKKHLWASLPVFALAAFSLPIYRSHLAGYAAYTAITLKCLADTCQMIPVSSKFNSLCQLCGRNVLFCYLFHIFLLQLFFRIAWPHRESTFIALLFIVIITISATAALSSLIERISNRFSTFRTLYRFIFL